MENKMDAQLIPNEELAEDALETPQPQQERPPSYPSTNAPVYSSGPPQPQYAPQAQGVYAPQPVQQGYIIQNIPVQQSPGCCSGRSEWFKHSVGVTTGVIQLVLAIIASILSGVAIYLHIRSDMFGGPMGSPIGSAIFFFLPAGILGACSKNKSNCVIVAYLVMSILAAIQGAFVCVVQVVLAVFSVDFDNDDCYDIHRYPYPNDAIYPSEEVEDIFPDIGYSCGPVRNKCLTALHSVIAILMFIELIVAIVCFCHLLRWPVLLLPKRFLTDQQPAHADVFPPDWCATSACRSDGNPCCSRIRAACKGLNKTRSGALSLWTYHQTALSPIDLQVWWKKFMD